MINFKRKKIYLILFFILITAGIVLYINKNSLKSNLQDITLAELPSNYETWLELSDEEKSKTVRPLAFDVSVNESADVKNSIKESDDTLPDTYDLRVYNGVKPVKNQRSWNACWAFAGTSSLESHMLNETRDDRYSNCISTEYELNPIHIPCALTYNFAHDVSNIYGNRPLNYGGNNLDNFLYWTSGIGPVSADNFKLTSESEPVIMEASEVLVQTEDIQVENAWIFPNIDMKNSSYEEKENYINLIKQTIMDNGAVSFGSMAPANGLSGYNDINKSVYTETAMEVFSASHMMLIVGWDDNYSKDNFNNGSITNEKPTIDGAWIVQNSWGTGDDIGVDGTGYYYYSYEDYGVNNGELASVAQTSKKEYDNIYQYNPSGEVRSSTGTYAANVFTKKDVDIEELKEISFFNFFPNTTYSIYVNPENDNLDIKNLECVKTYTDTNSFSEYVTIKLDDTIKLTGEKFAVIIKVENDEQTFNIPVQTNSHDSLPDEQVNIKESQSFISNDGKNWQDTKAQLDASVFIKAFTVNTESNQTINSSLDKEKVYLYGKEQAILVSSLTKNITDKNLVQYQILNSENENITDKFDIYMSNNDSTYYANIIIPNNYDYIGNYTLNILYNGEIKDTCNFEVERMLISDIKTLKDTIYLEIGKTNKLAPKIEIEPAILLNQDINFESKNPDIATVNENGLVCANSLGETSIKINSIDGSNITREIKVKVVDLKSNLVGTGTQDDPYIIQSADDLKLINADLEACYILNNDIDLSSINENDSRGWDPIGFLQKYKGDDKMGIVYFPSFEDSDAFSGSLDGNNYTITGLNINRPNEDGIALFSIVKNGKIKNLKIRNSSIIGNTYVSSFAAYCINATLENISSDANVNLCSAGAGIVAIANNNTSISKVFNRGNIVQERTSGNEKIYPGYLGGITACLKDSSINMSSNSGNVTTEENSNYPDAAGIAALIIGGKIKDVYNTGNIYAGFNAGGIVGEIYFKADIENVYNIGKITSKSNWLGDIVGYIDALNLSIDNAYALQSDNEAIGYISYIEEEENSVLNASKKTMEEMKDKSTYIGFEFDSIWTIEENSLPTLKQDFVKKAESLKIRTLPTKLEYILNKETLDLEGLKVLLCYNDGTEEEITVTDDMVSGFDNTLLGQQVITIEYQDLTTTFNINIKQNNIQSIYFMPVEEYYKFNPVIYQFNEGDTFDIEKILIYALYENNERREIDINDCTISKIGPLEVTDTKITISYTENGVTKSIDIDIKVYPDISEYFEGEGTVENPYLISTPEQLNKIRENQLASYKLKNDIDMTEILSENGSLYNEGNGWIGIGDVNKAFIGNFDGDNHKIIGLYSNLQESAMFSYTCNSTIKNLIIENAKFTGMFSSGIVNNALETKLDNLALINSTITANQLAAGIVNYANFNTKINKCYVKDCSIETTQNSWGTFSGGISSYIADNTNITNCYNTAAINGGLYTGGICGASEGNTLIECTYNIGTVSGNLNAGGICGLFDGIKIANCYDIEDEVSEIGDVDENKSTVINVKEKSIEEMSRKSTFENFDFDNVWQINENETPTFLYKNTEKIDISATLKWDDNNNQACKRPKNIILELYANGVLEETYEFNDTGLNEQSYVFSNLNKYDNLGNEIVYKVDVKEKNHDDLKFYSKTIDSKTNTIVNKFTVPDEKISINALLKFNDSSNITNSRPENLIIYLKNGDNVVREWAISNIKLDTYSHTFENLEKYNELGNEIIYTLYQDDIVGYNKEILGTTIENTIKTYKIKVKVNGDGGTILGNQNEIYEEVIYKGNAQKDIIIAPENGYNISNIKINGNNAEFSSNQDGTYTLNRLEMITEDKEIIITFEKKNNVITENNIKESEIINNDKNQIQEANIVNTGNKFVIVVIVLVSALLILSISIIVVNLKFKKNNKYNN